MRLWTVHPKYLDPQGLVALWREALLARAVLRGETLGYRHHPQLQRFQQLPSARTAINTYLASVLAEADARGYKFDRTKVGPVRRAPQIACTHDQLAFEWEHLLTKLARRSPALHQQWCAVERPEPHPLFILAAGPVEPWERGA